MKLLSATIMFFLLALGFHAEAADQKRVALILGNSAYKTLAPLKNSAGDARTLEGRLKDLKFEVVSGFDLDKAAMQGTIERFARIVRGADTALFFYAGHGIQVAGRNYLLPTDAILEDETSLDFETVSLDFILRQLSRETKVRLVFLDACRDDPVTPKGGKPFPDAGKGLAEVSFPDGGSGTLIAFATSPNAVAYDGAGDHSPFANALLAHISDKNVALTTVLTHITGDVYKATNGRQRPWVNSSLTDEVFLNDVVPMSTLIVGGETEQGESATRTVRSVEPAVPPPSDQAAINALRAQIPSLEGDDQIAFDKPVNFGDPEIDGKSIAQLISDKPRFAPIEGLDQSVWDKQCSSCHTWTKTALCEQAKTYDKNDVSIMRLKHPLGPRFKVALARWARGGCE